MGFGGTKQHWLRPVSRTAPSSLVLLDQQQKNLNK
jgi:hypothetical protein